MGTASRRSRPGNGEFGDDLFGNGEEVYQRVTPGCRRLLGSGSLLMVRGGKVESTREFVPSFITLQEAEVPESAVILTGLGGLEAVVGGESGGVDG